MTAGNPPSSDGHRAADDPTAAGNPTTASNPTTAGPSRRAVLLASMAGVTVVGMSLASCSGSGGPEGPPVSPGPFTDYAPRPVQRGSLRCLATQDKERLLLHTAGGDRSFWVGVNIGSTTPGHSPGEVAISRDDYRRWFALAGQMGVRVIRIYTIHLPHMYEELRAYNLAHPQAPLYLVHGIYLPDESYLETGDLFAKASTQAMVDEIRDASAAVHGTLRRAQRRGGAWGSWSADVSAWTAAWIVGVEWDPGASTASDALNAKSPLHRGRYFTNQPGATPTERWIAARMDELATLEAKQGVSVPIAHANWPTADPLRHPQEPLDREDQLSVDANHTLPTPAWPGGTFASYHAYPYYPDFQLLQPSYQNDGDPYRAYLLDLKRHHAGMPMMVSEFGVPSSLGAAHRGSLGRDQGHHTEQEAMAMDADMLRLFNAIGLAGGLVFAWSDEWFKFTWNTLPRHAPVHSERRALWHDVLTNEQFFGVIAHDPLRAGSRVIHESRTGITQVALDHDASWVYLTLTFERAPSGVVELGFDIIPGAGLTLPSGRAAPVNDVSVVVNIPQREATCWIRGQIDPVLLDGLPPASLPKAEPNGWMLQRLTMNRPYTVPGTTRYLDADMLDIGRLIEGTWELNSPQYSTQATWNYTEPQGESPATLRLRLPWGMLAMADPSSLTALVPKDNTGGKPVKQVSWEPTGVVIKGIGLVADAPELGQAYTQITWEGWNRAQYAERVKTGADHFAKALRDLA